MLSKLSAFEEKGDQEKAAITKLRGHLEKFDNEHAASKYFASDETYA